MGRREKARLGGFPPDAVCAMTPLALTPGTNPRAHACRYVPWPPSALKMWPPQHDDSGRMVFRGPRLKVRERVDVGEGGQALSSQGEWEREVERECV